MEEPSGVALPQSPLAYGDADSEQYARAVGLAPFHNAQPIRLS